MNSSSAVKVPRPCKELRDQIRRDQIVAAARECVVRHGFHAASMAEIAKAARMSVGQIYRYFSCKEAIIHSIVERIVAYRLQWMVRHQSNEIMLAELANRFLFGADDESSEDSVLMLEINAEATRNPAVAQIAREADRRLRAQAITGLLKRSPELSEQDASARVTFMAALAEGSALRRVTGLSSDDESVIELYRDVIGRVLTTSEINTP